jgi:hypothetical protein
LGLSSEQDRIPEAIALLPQIAQIANRCDELHHSPLLRQEQKDHQLQGLDPALWAAVLHILGNQWYHRVWIIQEASLAKTLRFLCGDHEISLQLLKETLESALYFLRIFDTYGNRVKISHYGRIIFSIRSLADTRRVDERRTEMAQTLMEISWATTGTHHCFYAQDRVFGLLGFVNEDDLTKNNFIFDTKISIPQLYTAFSSQLLVHYDFEKARKGLWNYLDLAFALSRDILLPSWVPDLHQLQQHDRC